jgi:hypothetical protein
VVRVLWTPPHVKRVLRTMAVLSKYLYCHIINNKGHQGLINGFNTKNRRDILDIHFWTEMGGVIYDPSPIKVDDVDKGKERVYLKWENQDGVIRGYDNLMMELLCDMNDMERTPDNLIKILSSYYMDYKPLKCYVNASSVVLNEPNRKLVVGSFGYRHRTRNGGSIVNLKWGH